MPLTMRTRQADQLQLALSGDLSPAQLDALGPVVGGYAEVAGRLGDLMPTTALRPSAEFRAELHSRLLDLAQARALELPDPAEVRAAARREPARGGVVLWLGRGWRRTLATGTAAVLALMVGVGFAAGSALPGGVLYPVKELIQNAQLRFAGGGLDRGRVLLDQARGHIADASALVAQGAPAPSDVDTALQAAGSDLSQAQQELLAQYARSHDPAALADLSRFATSQAPLLAELRTRVPVVSVPLVDHLLAQLGQTATAVKRVVAQCGSACAAVPVANLPGPDGSISSLFSGAGGTGGIGTGTGGLGTGGLGGTGVGGSGSSAGTGGGLGNGLGNGLGGVASLNSGGAGVNLPGVGATVPAPRVGVSSGGVKATVPPVKATVGPITATVPGVGITVPLGHPPGSTAPPAGSSSSSVCVLIVCVG
jgi:hypothetical protein